MSVENYGFEVGGASTGIKVHTKFCDNASVGSNVKMWTYREK
jgi:hypothetical protein